MEISKELFQLLLKQEWIIRELTAPLPSVYDLQTGEQVR